VHFSVCGLAHADANNPYSLSPQWEQWQLSIPASVNPALVTTDPSRETCAIGQSGPVWFLAGVFGGGTATRNCQVPDNVSLLFPVINYVNINTPNVCGQGPTNIPVGQLRAPAKAFIDGASDLSVQLDGRPVGMQRIVSATFAVALPLGNIFDSPCVAAGLGSVPGGVYSPAVDDGYYSLLYPLKAGNHTLRIKAKNTSQNFSLDVTYILTVVDVHVGNY